MLERIWSNRNTSPLLEEVQICTVTLKIIIMVSQKIGSKSTSRSNNTTLGHIPKRCSIILQGHLLNYVHSSIIRIARTWKQPRCLSPKEWIKKRWCISTMEYYSVVKNNDIMKFIDKWMELEKNKPE